MARTLAYILAVEFHLDEAGDLAFFPALAGCHSWASTCEEAIENAEEALVGYLEALQRTGEQLIR
jgi:predicted RNase H-like HicB family nuclease